VDRIDEAQQGTACRAPTGYQVKLVERRRRVERVYPQAAIGAE
jgi:hypothetical protein